MTAMTLVPLKVNAVAVKQQPQRSHVLVPAPGLVSGSQQWRDHGADSLAAQMEGSSSRVAEHLDNVMEELVGKRRQEVLVRRQQVLVTRSCRRRRIPP